MTMKMTRRFFLQSTGALAVYCGVSPWAGVVRGATAEEVSALNANSLGKAGRGKTLVVIFLRGGIDGLNLVVPYGDEHYGKLRKELRIGSPNEKDGALDLDGFFGLHPRAAALKPWHDAGHMVAAHAVGYDKNTRSHFEEQDVWETGVIGNTLGSDGWLNRHLQTSEGRGPIRAVALSDTLPRMLRGDATAYAIKGIDSLALKQKYGNADQVTAALEHAYQCQADEDVARALSPMMDEAREMVTQSGSETLEGVKLIRGIASQPYERGAAYPKGQLAGRLAEAARLIKSDIGLEVIEIDYGGWDTHNNQGRGIEGGYGDKVAELSNSLAAFAKDLGDRLNDTLVLTMSDFGRTAKENGTRGTDHGWANCMLALGGGVANTGEGGGRKVVTDWPGLAEDQLYQKRDLKDTTDFRDVLAEVVRVHLGNESLASVLPGHEFKDVGLVG